MENLFYLLFICLPAIIIAVFLNSKYKKRYPSRLSYLWGYFLGSQFILISIVFFVALFIDSSNSNYTVTEMFLSISISFLFFIVGLFSNKKQKWAIITLTILTLNPIIYFINWSYYKKRMKDFINADISSEDKFKNPKVSNKRHLNSVTHCILNFNNSQRIIFGIITNVLFFILAYTLMKYIGDEYFYRNRPIDEFDEFWIEWIIYLIIAGIYNIKLFETKKKKE